MNFREIIIAIGTKKIANRGNIVIISKNFRYKLKGNIGDNGLFARWPSSKMMV